MKFEGTRKSNDGSDTTIFVFAMNAKEANMLLALAKKCKNILPRFFNAGPIHGRLRNMISEVGDALRQHGYTKDEDYNHELYE